MTCGSSAPPAGHEDPPVDHLAQGGPNDRRRQVADRVEQLVVDPRTGGRGDAKDLLPRVGDGATARQHDVPEPRRHGLAVRSRATRRGPVRRRTGCRPVRSRMRSTRPASGAWPSSSASSRARSSRSNRARSIRSTRSPRSSSARKARKRPARIGLIGPDRRDEQDPLVAQVAHQEGQQVARRRVGPLEVLDR